MSPPEWEQESREKKGTQHVICTYRTGDIEIVMPETLGFAFICYLVFWTQPEVPGFIFGSLLGSIMSPESAQRETTGFEDLLCNCFVILCYGAIPIRAQGSALRDHS